MKKLLLLSVLCVLVFSGPIFAKIVYSGSQDVTLRLQGGMSPPPEMAMISIAGSPGEWDDFIISLEYEMGMPMGMMDMGTRLTIGGMGMGMGMGKVVVTPLTVMGILLPAMNLSYGALIDSSSPLDGSAILLEAIGGQTYGEFGEEGGYIGLAMPGSTYYAWLRVSGMTDIGDPTQTVTFNGWAYEDVDGKPIGAGVIPVPGAIILGGLGISLVTWLRKHRAL